MGRGLSALRGGSGKAGRQTLLQKRNFYSGRSRGISQVLKAKSPIFLQWMRGYGFERRKLPDMGHPHPRLSLGPELTGLTSAGPPGCGYSGQRALGSKKGVGTTLTGSLAFLTPRTRLSPLCPCAQQFCPRHDPAREAGSSTPPALHRRGDRDPGRGADGSSPRAERRDRQP